MGYKLAEWVASPTWAHLSLASSRVLAYIALHVLDDDAPPRWWGGHGPLVLTLYGEEYEEGPRREGQYRRVRRLVDELCKEGALVPLKSGHRGRNAEYEIRVTPAGKQGHQSPALAKRRRHRKQGHQSPAYAGSPESSFLSKAGSPESEMQGHQSPPEEEAGVTQDQEVGEGGIDRVPAQPHLGAHDVQQIGIGSSAELCVVCRRPEVTCRARSARPGREHEYQPRGAA